MRTRAQADILIRVVLLAGLAIGITGVVVVSTSKGLGIALAVVGFAAAALGPALICVPDKSRETSDRRARIHD